MINKRYPLFGIQQHRKIINPTCWYHTDFGNIIYVDDANGERSNDESVNNFQDG